MRVLHVIPSIGLARGGPSVVIRTMARAQVEQGLEVHVVSTDDNGAGRLDASSGRHFTEHGVVYRLFPRQLRFYTVSLPLIAWLWKHAAGYDVIHIHALFSYPSIAAAWCAEWSRVPYVVRPLGTLNKWGMSHRRPWLKQLSFHAIESRILRKAAGVQFTSQQESAEAAQLGVNHVSLIIPNPVAVTPALADRGRFRAAHPTLGGKRIVLFLSRIDVKKGIDLLLPAFAQLLKDFPDIALVLAGDGDPALIEALKQQARQLVPADAIVWAGFLQGEAKRNAFADSDIFVLPSYSENFGVSVVEAMSHGLPIVVSDQVALHTEIAKIGAGLVVPCEVPQLSRALATFLADPELCRTAGESGQVLAAEYSPATVAEKMISIYRKICHGDSLVAMPEEVKQAG